MQTWEFKHPNFRADMKDSLEHIKVRLRTATSQRAFVRAVSNALTSSPCAAESTCAPQGDADARPRPRRAARCRAPFRRPARLGRLRLAPAAD